MSVHAGSIWIDRNFASVPQDLWIAADATRLVGENRNLTLLLNFLVTQQFQLSDLTITYVPSGTFQ